MKKFLPAFFLRLFSKKKIQTSKPENKDTLIDIYISLTKDYQIDLSMYIDDKSYLAKKNIFEFSQKCAEFLNIINNGKLTNQMTSIMLDQIRNEDNQILIENIIMFWALIDKEETNIKDAKEIKNYILPSQVFPKYTKANQL